MGELFYKFKSLLKAGAGYAGIRLIDPIEVYFMPKENTFYPIISKSGCTSIKAMLIQKYNPDYENTFPGIHQVNPAKITDNAVQRIYFKTKRSYLEWSKGKIMVFVMRDPLSRIYSCYLDVTTGKNTMYKFPSGLSWVYNYSTDLSFDDFIRKVCATPDRFSDRHFRSQSFFISDAVRTGLASLETFTLKEYMSNASPNSESEENQSVKLNANKSSISDELRTKLIQNEEFNERFKTDLHLYESIRQKMP